MSVPSHFGRYRVLRPLATGEMGVVYLAEDPLIGRKVAIKGIRFDPYADDEEIQRLQARFDQEIQIAGTFSHPNIVTVYDVGRQSGRSFIAMEYVDGRNLRAELQASGPLSPGKAVKLVVPLCRALAYAHERDVVHRDIKPTNILVSSEGVPKITDFGVARLFGSTLTNAGKIFGTPAYMSPEQAVGGKLTGACDQFALCTVLYELLTGERPFRGTSPTAVIYEVLEHDPPPPHEIAPLVPTAVSAVIMRGLKKEPGDRFPDCDALADALKEAMAWTRANPELAYLEEDVEVVETTSEISLGDWRTAAARVRRRSHELLDAALASQAWKATRTRALHALERPRSLAALAGGVLALITLVTAVTWAASAGHPLPPLSTLTTGDPGVLAAHEPAAGDLPDRDRGVSRGSASHDLEATAAPAAALSDGVPETGSVRETKVAVADTEPAGANTEPGEGSAAVESESRSLTVASRPAGASISLDGHRLGDAAPASIVVREGQQYILQIEKEGYRPVHWPFRLEDLSDQQLTSGELFFPLEPLATSNGNDRLASTAGRGAVDAAGRPIDGGPPPAPTRVRRVRAPAETPAPEKVHHVDPLLPEGTVASGVVVLEIEVSARGNVVQAKVLRGLDEIANQAALDAVVRWKYEPTEVSGDPVHVLMTVSLPLNRSR